MFRESPHALDGTRVADRALVVQMFDSLVSSPVHELRLTRAGWTEIIGIKEALIAERTIHTGGLVDLQLRGRFEVRRNRKEKGLSCGLPAFMFGMRLSIARSIRLDYEQAAKLLQISMAADTDRQSDLAFMSILISIRDAQRKSSLATSISLDGRVIEDNSFMGMKRILH